MPTPPFLVLRNPFAYLPGTYLYHQRQPSALIEVLPGGVDELGARTDFALQLHACGSSCATQRQAVLDAAAELLT